MENKSSEKGCFCPDCFRFKDEKGRWRKNLAIQSNCDLYFDATLGYFDQEACPECGMKRYVIIKKSGIQQLSVSSGNNYGIEKERALLSEKKLNSITVTGIMPSFLMRPSRVCMFSEIRT